MSAASIPSQFLRVDDSDTNSLEYSNDGDGWVKGGVSEEFMGTTHGARTAGSTVTFRFTGTAVEVYGTLDSENLSGRPDPVSTFMLDSNVTTYRPSLGPTTQYRQLFFQASSLEPTDHVLLINSTVQDSEFWLDYLMYIPVGNFVEIATPTTTITSTVRVTQTVSVITSLELSPSSTAAASVASVTSAPVSESVRADHTRVIAGVVGGVGGFLILCLLGGIIYHHRRRRAARTTSFTVDQIPPPNFREPETSSYTSYAVVIPSLENGAVPPSSKSQQATRF